MRLKIKKELQFFPLENGLFHVYDPATTSHFKIAERQVEWLKMLDGTRTKTDLKEHIPEDLFEQFFEQIEALGLLEGNETKEKRDIFKIKFQLVKANEILEKTMIWNVLFRKLLNRTAFFIVLANIALLFFNYTSIASMNFRNYIGLPAILFFIVGILITGMFHEACHAISAKSYGVNVPSIGMMLLYFMPAFYTDISGMNILNNRGQRVKILLAGLLGNNILTLVGLIMFHSLHVQYPALAFQGLILAGLNGILSLMNMIPFVEYDGFFILNTLFEEGNIKENAMGYVAMAVQKRSLAHLRLEHFFFFVFSRLFGFAMIFLAVSTVRSILPFNNMIPYGDVVFLVLVMILFALLQQRDLRRPS